jgi:hypothetical protein
MNNWIRMLIVIAASIAMGAAPCAFGAGAPRQSAADASDEITVKAKGEGADPTEAKNDATRAALRQAVGSFVDVKTVTDGDRIVTDRILSATGALVIGSKVISGPKRRGDGLYEVECEVRIRKRNLVATLTESGFTLTGAIDGDAAKRVSAINFKNAKEAEVLLAERVDTLWSKLMIGRLLDDKGVPLGDGELPTVVAQKDGTVIVCANVQIYFHLEAYYTKFVPEMKALLEALAVRRGEAMVNRATWNEVAPAPQSRFGGVPAYAYGSEPTQQQLSDSPNRVTLWISDGRDESGLNEHFSGFELTAETALPILQAAKRFGRDVGRGSTLGFRLELLDGNGGVVASQAIPLFQRSLAMMQTTQDEAPRLEGSRVPVERLVLAPWTRILWSLEQRCLLISPSFGIHQNYGRAYTSSYWNRRQEPPYSGSCCDVFETREEIVLPASDLANVRGYRVTAVE